MLPADPTAARRARRPTVHERGARRAPPPQARPRIRSSMTLAGRNVSAVEENDEQRSRLGARLVTLLLVVTGFGIAIGYHRLFTHRSFAAKRWFKILLASVGSCALEGSVTGWVANHRRHHRFSDMPGDPHSPHEYG